MSEYWKSTPKYWCKFCSVFVKDTKFEKQQHEATPRHQGGIQRSLRELHKGKEREDREKQRAKDEVARLNGVVGGRTAEVASSSNASVSGSGKQPNRQASAEERKRQMQQLADMGVAVPEEFRREVALAGEWERVSVVPIVDPESMKAKAMGGEANVDSLAFGVRKRKFEDQVEEEAIHAVAKRQAWGSKFKTYPGSKGNSGDDLDVLLGGLVTKKEEKGDENSAAVKTEGSAPIPEGGTEHVLAIKQEEVEVDGDLTRKLETSLPESVVKAEDTGAASEASKPAIEIPGAGIVFKKRKPKATKKT